MRGKYLLMAALVATTAAEAEQDLGLITVESSTFVDMDVDKKTETSTVNIIDEQIITDINPKNINEILQTIPGITADVRSDVVEIHMRGVGQQEFMWEDTGVVIVIDGVPVLQDGGKIRGLNIDEIASIKVIKGGASYLYGNTALAGAVIITTKKNRHKNGGDISAEYGSYGYQNYKANLYRSTDKYSLSLFGGYKDEDGYWYKTQNDQKTLNGKATYYIDDSSEITLGVDITDKYQESTRGSVTGVTAAESNPEGVDGDWAYSHDYYSDIYKYYLKYDKDFESGGSFSSTLYYYEDLYEYESSPQDTDGDGNDDAYIRSSNDDITQYGLKMEYRSTIDKLGYMVGLDIGKRESEELDKTLVDYDYTSYRGTTYYRAGESFLDTTTEDRYALYGEVKYAFTPKLTTTANIRFDYDKYTEESDDYDYNGTDWENTSSEISESFKNVSYRIGFTYELSEQSMLYSSVSTGFRNPTAGQFATNSDLDPETSISYELGLRGKLFDTGLSYEASLFLTNTYDIIAKDQGTYYWTRVTRYENVGDARNQGLELMLKSDSSKKWSFSLAYTYLDAYYTSHDPFTVALEGDDPTYDITDNQLPRTPHHKIDFILNYKPSDKWHFMAEFYAQSSYYADETNFVEMDGYGKLNLKVTYKPKENLEIFAKVDNVFDNQYYRTVYLFSDRNDDGVLDSEDASITVDPGRVIYVGMKYKF